MSKHIYIALDSDVLCNLSNIDEYLSVNPKASDEDVVKFLKKSDPRSPAIKTIETYMELLRHAKDKSSPLRFLITPSVYGESGSYLPVEKFIKNYCYFPNTNVLLNIKNQEQIRTLAAAYCQQVVKGDKICKAPMQAKYNALLGMTIPSNDAMIMAEATFYHAAFLLTENVKDLIDVVFHGKPGEDGAERNKYNARVRGIVDVNIQNGYGQESDSYDFASSSLNVTKPCSVYTFGKFIKDIHNRLSNYVSAEDEKMLPIKDLEL